MAERRFDIIFDGSISEDCSVDEVKKNLQRLFKLDPATVEKLFSGSPVAIKKNLDRKEAQQYQSALTKAGAKIQLVLNRESDPSAPLTNQSVNTDSKTTESKTTETRHQNPTSAPSKAETIDSSLQTLPAGSNLLEDHEKPIVENVVVNVDHINTLSTAQFEAKELEPHSAPADFISSGPTTLRYPSNQDIPVNESITLAEKTDPEVYGLMTNVEKENTVSVDIDHLTLQDLSEIDEYSTSSTNEVIETLDLNINFELLEAGEDLLNDSEKNHYEAAEIDTSALTLSNP